MAGRKRNMRMIAIGMFFFGDVAMIPSMGNAAEKNTVVTGIVGYARGRRSHGGRENV